MPPLPKGRWLAKGETVGYLACIYEPVHYLVAAVKIYSAIKAPLLKGAGADERSKAVTEGYIPLDESSDLLFKPH